MASARQLAALKRGRPKRKATLAKKKVTKKPRKKVKKVKRNPKNSKPSTLYLIEVKVKGGDTGYLSSVKDKKYKFDSSISKAIVSNNSHVMDTVAIAINSTSGKYLDSIKVKKFNGRRGKNPVPASSKVRLQQAAKLYENFSGHDAEHIDTVTVDWPQEGLTVGKCDAILYTTIRDGETENYIHRFKKSARPLLAASHDGAQLALLGGDFTFTERGIVDN